MIVQHVGIQSFLIANDEGCLLNALYMEQDFRARKQTDICPEVLLQST